MLALLILMANNMTEKNKGGRPALPDDEKAKVRSVRLTDARWGKLRRLGGAEWLNRAIDKAKESAD